MNIAILIVLLASHILVLALGWYMGTKADRDMLMSKPAKKEIYEEKPDIFDEERLDYS
ncbi:MAG: hypothetical protein H8E41_11145 [Desulfobulbaceae bacterium]|uniref:Uncharacterized protein n=1 Tax=Candidatus Desulfobia pelagia TaxID=2841692 RepID=A0A8J6NEZ6_9BACT|nr:hypothetical protein [Candidatus Desulfobia pelagia]